MIKVKVRAYATLRRYLPDTSLGRAAVVELPTNATIGDVLEWLGIPREETKVCFVNGVRQELDIRLHEDDELGIFPAIAGG